jgi:hypothetical protein
MSWGQIGVELHLQRSKGWRNGKIMVMNHGEDKRLRFKWYEFE